MYYNTHDEGMENSYWREGILLVFLDLRLAKHTNFIDIIDCFDLRQASDLGATLLQGINKIHRFLQQLVILDN